MIIINGGGGGGGDSNDNSDGKKLPKLEGRQAFVRGGGRRNYRCFSGKLGGWCRGSGTVRDASSVGSNAVLLLIMPDWFRGVGG